LKFKTESPIFELAEEGYMSHEQERFLNVSNSPFKTVPQVFRIPSLNLLESAVSNELEAQKSHPFPHRFPK